jgi:hypothetical protein
MGYFCHSRLFPLLLCALPLVVVLNGCGGGTSVATDSRTGSVVVQINWPPPAATVGTAAIPANATCVQVTLSNGSGWSAKLAAVRPQSTTTSLLTIPGVPVGAVHMHVGAYRDYTNVNQNLVVSNLLAWAVKDVTVVAESSLTVGFTLSGDPYRVGVTAAGSTTLDLGGQVQLTATAYDSEDNVLLVPQFTWSATAPLVAEVDGMGLVSAFRPGSSTVRASVGSVSGEIGIAVASPHHIVITPSTINVPYGADATLQAKAYNAAGVELPVQEDSWAWSTSEPTQLSLELTYVGDTATVRTNMPSQVPITVYATVGTTQGTATVTTVGVISPHHIVITPSTINVPYGTEATLQAKAYNAAGAELPVPADGWTWTTSETTQLHVELTYVGNTATVRTNMPSQVPITVYATVGTTQGTATVTTFGVTGGY